MTCEVCKLKPSIKTLRGCTEPPCPPVLFPPLNLYYEGERFHLNTCPVNMFTFDVVEVFRKLNLSGQNVSITEQEEMPGPYVEALIEAKAQQLSVQASRMKSKTNG